MMNTRSLRPHLTGLQRAEHARNRRMAAISLAQDAQNRPAFEAMDNGDNARFETRPMAFTKGLLHDAFGNLVDRADFTAFERALTQGAPNSETDVAFDVPGTARTCAATFHTRVTPKGSKKAKTPEPRTWESPLSGTSYVEEGPDPAAIAMPPAPRLGSSELCAEMAEVYAMALVRDMDLNELCDPAQVLYYKTPDDERVDYVLRKAPVTVQDLLDALNAFAWFRADGTPLGGTSAVVSHALSDPEDLRRMRGAIASEQTPQTLFRGSAFGTDDGDYLSKFLQQEFVSYGAQTIDQKITPETSGLDYMTSWTAWLDVQNGADLRGIETTADHPARMVTTGRDLARYVHIDALYQAYHVAALMMLGDKTPASDGFPEPNKGKTRDAFATFGGPHVLALFAEVSSRALKAVRRQKFQIHRRARPERLAALITLAANGKSDTLGSAGATADRMLDELQTHFGGFLELVAQYNAVQNSDALCATRKTAAGIETPAAAFEPASDKNYLLPMAFPEGSPMHPAYGAGHATVAGACVTVLKAFFQTVEGADWQRTAFAGQDGLTLEGELNKLAANISIGRDFAGVHFYSDYYESLRLGERVATGILQEQMLNYNEPVAMRFHSFDGDRIQIKTDGKLDVRIDVSDQSGSKHIQTSDWWLRHTGSPEGIATSNWLVG